MHRPSMFGMCVYYAYNFKFRGSFTFTLNMNTLCGQTDLSECIVYACARERAGDMWASNRVLWNWEKWTFLIFFFLSLSYAEYPFQLSWMLEKFRNTHACVGTYNIQLEPIFVPSSCWKKLILVSVPFPQDGCMMERELPACMYMFRSGGAAAYQLGNTSSRMITEVKQR